MLVLSGSSSSGKTSLAKALLTLMTAPTVLIEADAAFPSYVALSDVVDPPIVVFHRSLNTWLGAGFDVVVDGSLPYGDVERRQQCLDELPEGRTFLVGVSCSVEELRRREGSRPDSRLAGWAERQAADVNDGLPLLAAIDTSQGPPVEHARRVLVALGEAHDR